MKSRFGKIGKSLVQELHNRYGSLDSIREYDFYKVPKELIINSHYAEYRDGNYYLNYNNFSSRVWATCELSAQDYYDILVLGIWNKSQRPKCPVCGRYVEFKCLVQGYKRFDTKGCALSYRNAQPEEKERLRKHLADLNYFWQSLPFSDKRCSRRVSIKSRRNEFLNRGEYDDICYMYLAHLDDGTYKFGITNDIDGRGNFQYMNDVPKFKYVKCIFESNRLEIANLEAYIKFEFEGSEYFSPDQLQRFYQVFDNLLVTRPVADYID